MNHFKGNFLMHSNALNPITHLNNNKPGFNLWIKTNFSTVKLPVSLLSFFNCFD